MEQLTDTVIGSQKREGVERYDLRPLTLKGSRAHPYKKSSIGFGRHIKKNNPSKKSDEAQCTSTLLCEQQRDRNLFFVMEKLTPKRKKVWDSIIIKQQYIQSKMFASALKKLGEHIKSSMSEASWTEVWSAISADFPDCSEGRRYKIISGMSDGLSIIRDVFYRYISKNECWVCYACNRNEKSVVNEGETDHIEMVMAVCTDEDLPFQMHMGITRMPEYMLHSPDKTHTGLSLSLHQYAARAVRLVSAPKSYIISAPSPAMKNILHKAFDERGSNYLLETSESKKEESKRWLSISGEQMTPDNQAISNWNTCLVLRNKYGEVLFSISEAEMEACYPFLSIVLINKALAVAIDIEGFLQLEV